MTLKEKQPLFLRNLVYSTLKEGQINVDQNYSIFCVVNTLCERQTTEPPTTITMTPSNISTTVPTETKDKSNATNFAIVIAITAVTVVVLLILILLVIMAIVLRFKRRKQKEKQTSLTTLHMTNPHQSANENVASNEHPANIFQPTKENVASDKNSCQSGNENVASNKHPSTSSDEGYDEGESVSFLTQHTGNPINDFLQNGNERIPPVPTDINPVYTNKHKTKTSKTNFVLKHHRNVPLDHEIQWKQNETYQDLCISTTRLPSAAPVPDFKPLVTKEVKPENYYDDVVGISETTRKACAAASHMHHEIKHPQSKLPDMTQRPKSVHNNHNVLFHSITTSRNVAKSLNNINHNNLPSSEV